MSTWDSKLPYIGVTPGETRKKSPSSTVLQVPGMRFVMVLTAS